jgi:hypothetical protein
MGDDETVYELYAFKPDGIATFRPKSHHTMAHEAKKLAVKMLQDISTGAPVSCHGCRHDFTADLPAALIVLVPKDPELRLAGGCLRQRCLTCEDLLEIVAAAFGRVIPGARLEAVQ